MPKPKETSRPSQLSEEKVYDSSDDDDNTTDSPTESSSTPALKQATGKATNGTVSSQKKPKQKAVTPDSSSSSEQDSDNESTSGEKSVDSETGEDTDKDSSSPSDSESVSNPDSGKRKSPSQTNQQTPRKKSKTTATSTTQIAPKQFKAPHGYEPIILSASDYAAEGSSLFKDLKEKQIWHISAPDTISIENIEELDIQAALQGKAILSRDGVDYNMQPATSFDNILLLPQGSNSSYQQSATNISRSFHVRQMSSKPKQIANEQADAPIVFTAVEEGREKVVRQQPKGLKMRYTPFGSTAAPQQYDTEMVTEPTTLQLPDEVVDERSPEKRKKKKQAAIGEDDAMQIDGQSSEKTKSGKDKSSASSERKKKKKRRIVDEDVSWALKQYWIAQVM